MKVVWKIKYNVQKTKNLIKKHIDKNFGYAKLTKTGVGENMKTEIQKIIDNACSQKEKTGQIILSQQDLDLLDNYYLDIWQEIENTRRKFKGYRPNDTDKKASILKSSNKVYRKYIQFHNKRENDRLNYLITERTTVEAIMEDAQVSETSIKPAEPTEIVSNVSVETDISPKEEISTFTPK